MTCLVAQQHFAATYTVADDSQLGTCEVIGAEGVAAAYHLGEGGEFGPGDPLDAGMSLVAAHVAHAYTDAQWNEGFVQTSKYAAHFAKFDDTYPDDAGICRPAGLSEVAFTIPAVADDPETPDEDESAPAEPWLANWKDVEVTVTHDTPGTYFEGQMTVTRSCGTVVYDVRAFTPILGCETDADCEIVSDIDPDWKAHCEPDLHVSWMTWDTGTCVLD